VSAVATKKAAICSGFVFLKEPSDGLEPSTPLSMKEGRGSRALCIAWSWRSARLLVLSSAHLSIAS
jgi:hypothetical protein